MKTRDITDAQAIEHLDFKIIECFYKGFIVAAEGDEYRYARKDQPLYEHGPLVYVATESGFYQKFNDDTEGSFRWVFIAIALGFAEKLIAKMTKEEKIHAVSALAFDNVIRNK